MKSEALADGGTPIYVARFDGVRVPAADYRPVLTPLKRSLMVPVLP